MLTIKHSRQNSRVKKWSLLVAALVMLGGGIYLLTLVAAPVVAPYFASPIKPSSLAVPRVGDNRVIIPKSVSIFHTVLMAKHHSMREHYGAIRTVAIQHLVVTLSSLPTASRYGVPSKRPPNVRHFTILTS